MPAPQRISLKAAGAERLKNARHSLFVRRMLIERGLVKSSDLNRESLSFVTAGAQAEAFSRIEHLLLDDEMAVFKRAQNSTHLNKPKHASGKDYRVATGFEAVIGMLHYLGREARLLKILEEGYKETENDTED